MPKLAVFSRTCCTTSPLVEMDTWKVASVFGALGLIMTLLCLRFPLAAARRGFLWGMVAAAVLVMIVAFVMRGR